MRSISILFCALASLPVAYVDPVADACAIIVDYLLLLGQELFQSRVVMYQAQLSQFDAAQLMVVCRQLKVFQENYQNNPGLNTRIDACERVVLPSLHGKTIGFAVQTVQLDQLWSFVALGDLGTEVRRRALIYAQRFNERYLFIVTDYICGVVDPRTVDSMLHACDHTTFHTDWPSYEGCKWMQLLYKNSPIAIPLLHLFDDLGLKIKQDQRIEGEIVDKYFSNILVKRERENDIYTFCTGPNVTGKKKHSKVAKACQMILSRFLPTRLTLGSGSS